jgi:hypothetical protein
MEPSRCARVAGCTHTRACACAHTRTHPQVCATCAPTCVRTGVHTAVLTGVRTGRRPQRRPTSSLAIEPHGSHPLLRLTFAPSPRPCPAHSLEDHRPSPRTPSLPPCLHAPPPSLLALPLSLLLARCSCCSRSRLSFVLSVPPDPALSVPPLSSLHLLVVVLNPVLTVPNHSPKFSPWCGGVVGNWKRGIHGSTKPNMRRLSDASDERIGERIEQESGGTVRRRSVVADAARRWWPARGGRVSCATRRRSPP